MTVTSQTAHQRIARLAALVAIALLVAATVLAQGTERGSGVTVPANAQALEGLPDVRVEATKDRVVRRTLDAAESARSRLTITIVDGQFYWGARTGRPLTVTNTGSFTYLSSTEPGRYIRIQELNDTLSYVEHVDMDFGSVTYWGALRVVLQK
jgi:hypothetical protein